MTVTFCNDPQQSEGWFAARKGRITGSKFKVARDKLKSGKPTGKAILYARDVARERMGGTVAPIFQNGAMRTGIEQEPLARMAYETTTGYMVQEVGFAATDCGMFGLSPDGLIDDDGVLEVKTMVGSDNLFDTVINEDYSEYMDQCLGYLLFLDREWVDLVLWTPDLEQYGLGLVIHRIARGDNLLRIQELADDLTAFAAMVAEFENQLRARAKANVKSLSKFLPEELDMTESENETGPHDDAEIAAFDARQAEQEAAQLVADAQAVIDKAKMPEIVDPPIVVPVGMSPADELRAVQSMPEGAELSPAAQVLNEAEGAVRFAKAHTPPTLKLGVISTRLGFQVTAEFLRILGFEPAGRERAAVLYHESDFPRICTALILHITEVRQGVAA